MLLQPKLIYMKAFPLINNEASFLVKILLCLGFILGGFTQGNSQGIPVNQSTDTTRIHQDSIQQIEAKLIELAFKGPRVSSSKHQNKINELQLKRARNAWTNLLTVSANYNDISLSQNNQVNQNVVFPKYFFGLTIPIGTLLSRTEIKSAKEQIEISKNNQESQERALTKEVLSLFYQYQNYRQQILLQNEIIDDESTAFLKAEQKFRDGEINIEQYNTASKLYNEEKVKLLNLKLQQALIKLDIEEIIGVKMDSIIRPN